MYIVYGGSFNPPTKAHFNIVNKLLKTYENSKIIILPVGNDYSKKYLLDFKHRFNMLSLLFENNKDIIISNLENSNKFLGTLDSLNKLSDIYGKLSFVIGSDNINGLDKWINFETLIKNTHLIIMRRNNDNVNLMMDKYKKYSPSYDVLNINELASSTKVRNNINENKSLIDEKVYEYILNNKLYGSDQNV